MMKGSDNDKPPNTGKLTQTQTQSGNHSPNMTGLSNKTIEVTKVVQNGKQIEKNETKIEKNSAYWNTMKEGPKGNLVKIKEEKTDENQYSALQDDDESQSNDDLYDNTEFEAEFDNVVFDKLTQEMANKMDKDKMAEYVYQDYLRTNKNTKKSKIYAWTDHSLRTHLEGIVKENVKKLFLADMRQIAQTVQMLDPNDTANEEEVIKIVTHIYQLSGKEKNIENYIQEFERLHTIVTFIEQFSTTKPEMIPKESPQIPLWS